MNVDDLQSLCWNCFLNYGLWIWRDSILPILLHTLKIKQALKGRKHLPGNAKFYIQYIYQFGKVPKKKTKNKKRRGQHCTQTQLYFKLIYKNIKKEFQSTKSSQMSFTVMAVVWASRESYRLLCEHILGKPDTQAHIKISSSALCRWANLISRACCWV